MHALLSRTLGDDIELAIEFAGEDWLIEADRSELENALLNMANNSRDAMPEGGRLTIRVEARTFGAGETGSPDLAPGDHLVMTVIDTGCGMPPEVRERAFEPFFTAKGPDGGGTGLGLSMVYGFVRRSGGIARILSTLGQGTTIELIVPRHHPADAPADAPAAARRPLRGTEHILLVEDDVRVRGFVRRTLEGLGYRITEATDGQQAMALIDGGEFYDLVLSDIELPGGVSGLDLAARVEDHLPRTRILLMSGYPDRAMARADWRDRPVLSKPFGPRELARAVRDGLERARP
jgi:CheY-like chemotaxis protein